MSQYICRQDLYHLLVNYSKSLTSFKKLLDELNTWMESNNLIIPENKFEVPLLSHDPILFAFIAKQAPEDLCDCLDFLHNVSGEKRLVKHEHCGYSRIADSEYSESILVAIDRSFYKDIEDIKILLNSSYVDFTLYSLQDFFELLFIGENIGTYLNSKKYKVKKSKRKDGVILDHGRGSIVGYPQNTMFCALFYKELNIGSKLIVPSGKECTISFMSNYKGERSLIIEKGEPGTVLLDDLVTELQILDDFIIA